jgi:hypothetical protein
MSAVAVQHQWLPRNRRWISPCCMAAIAVLSCLLCGCGDERQAAVDSSTKSLQTKPGVPAVASTSLEVLHTRVMDFTTGFMGRIAEASDSVLTPTSSLEMRIEVLTWKIGNVQAALNISVGKNPVVNAMDLLVLVSLGRMEVEAHWRPLYGAQCDTLVTAYRELEQEATAMFGGVLDSVQLAALNALIAHWHDTHPTQHQVASVRLADFADARAHQIAHNQKDTSLMSALSVGSVFKLIGIDPLSGLDPAVDQIAETRRFAERAMRQLQSMPMLMSWQVQLMSFQMMATPELRRILADSSRISEAIDRAVTLAATLPGVVDVQREKITHDLVHGSDSLSVLVAELRRTLEAAGVSADKITQTVLEVDRLSRTLAPAPSAGVAVAPAPTPAKPFDITEYQKTMVALAATSDHLQELVRSTQALIESQGMQNLQHQTDQAMIDARAASDHLLHRVLVVGMELIGCLAVATLLVAALYRLLHHHTRPT